MSQKTTHGWILFLTTSAAEPYSTAVRGRNAWAMKKRIICLRWIAVPCSFFQEGET